MLATLTKCYPDIQTTLSNVLNHDELEIVEKHNDVLLQVLHCSVFAQESIRQNPSDLMFTLKNAEYSFHLEQYHQLMAVEDKNEKELGKDLGCDEQQLDRHLRQQRTGAMLRIIWRDALNIASLNETTTELSYLAQASLWAAFSFHNEALITEYGTPVNIEGETQAFLILGMGKLGAYELNLSSDIDLIFAYPEQGKTTGGSKKPIDNQVFFTRLGQKVIQSIDKITADGFVFRVDMRLRPYGQSGALVGSFASLENYYQNQGREWERYAMIKARVVLNSLANTDKHTFPDDEDIANHIATQTLKDMLQPFIYRRYIDYSVVDALRQLKQSIRQEVRRRGLENDVKLSSGGIREIEFIAQTFQLIRGGRDKSLQSNRLLYILDQLANLECLPLETCQDLKQAYIFLRRSEHGIQAYRDKQTQTLPQEDASQQALLNYMGYGDWPTYISTLNTHRELVDNEFRKIISEEDTDSDNAHTHEGLEKWEALWKACLDISDNGIANEKTDKQSNIYLSQSLITLGFDTDAELLKNLRELSSRIASQVQQETGRERVDEFMPRLFAEVVQHEQPSRTLKRILPLVHSVARRSAYLLLLIENPSALVQLVKLSAASPWIAEQLRQQPALLDELLDERALYHLPSKEELENELQRALLRVDENDLEDQMNVLRHFRSSHALRVAACEISNTLPLMKVSDYLSFLAEAILSCSVPLVWKGLVNKHGYPDGDEREQPRFCVIGYGKLGGIELSHGSDLDLVFLYDAKPNGNSSGNAEGRQQIANPLFYTRLGQKLIHLLNTQMASGRLYEVDMRLRPSGNSGQLCTRLEGFRKYQLENAWTWEHQALVRARPVAGDHELAEQFQNVRSEILCKKRALDILKKDVTNMREKMRAHLGKETKSNSTSKSLFHLKQDSGGIVDIEFMVQYTVLAWSYEQPDLVRFTDNIRILECLAQTARLPTQEVEQLTTAYKAYRSAGHRRTLQQESNLFDVSDFSSERASIVAIWEKLFN